MNKKKFTYKKSGVNIKAADKFVDFISTVSAKKRGKKKFSNIGGFGSITNIPGNIKQPRIVACTDGVGTKIEIANTLNKFDTIGIDLVAMSVNDLIVQGAKPLLFLDYISINKIDLKKLKAIIKGINKGCNQSECELVGGETAEMPGHYAKGNFDLAGFAVGVVDKSKIISGKKIKTNHVILGIESSGPHSNGYSLIRKILSRHKPPSSVLKTLLKPTHLYTSLVNDVVKKNIKVSGIANITGGGITENIPRIIPKDLAADIDLNGWKFPKAFQWLQEKGKISNEDMLRIFNCGIGLAIILPLSEVKSLENLASKYKFKTHRIGKIVKRTQAELTYLN